MSIRPVTEYPMLPQPGRATPAGLAQHQGFMVAALVRHFGELGFAINRLIKRTRFGELADRPDAGEADRFFLATDQSPVELYYDDGSQWHLIASQVGKDIGDVPQYEDDGSGNPVLDHPNMPLVGGDPVVDSGSNADGEWVRYSDGTQIVSGNYRETGDDWKTADPKRFIDFPVNFVNDSFRINLQARTDDTAWAFAVSEYRPDRTSGGFAIIPASGVTDSGTSVEIDWSAIGSWK